MQSTHLTAHRITIEQTGANFIILETLVVHLEIVVTTYHYMILKLVNSIFG